MEKFFLSGLKRQTDNWFILCSDKETINHKRLGSFAEAKSYSEGFASPFGCE